MKKKWKCFKDNSKGENPAYCITIGKNLSEFCRFLCFGTKNFAFVNVGKNLRKNVPLCGFHTVSGIC